MSIATATFQIPAPRPPAPRCAECAARVCAALEQVPGVVRADCSSGSTVVVEFDPARVSEAELAAEVERFGMELAESVAHAAWRVTGLD